MGVNVAEFYEGKSILITGVTGFIGKVLMEKLLRSCPGIDKIYIFIRDKRTPASQRIQTLMETPVFTRLKQENPSAVEKIIPIKVDLTTKNLGLTSDDEKLLIDKVAIVFHVAASTKFNETFEKTFNVNVGGTERMLSLCKRMKVIQKFVYVSTAYSNADKPVIEEHLYPAIVSPKEMKKLLINGISNKKIKRLLNGKPNTYTLTKSIAEEVIKLDHGHVPSIIIRPSIVTSCITEPVPGWIDNWAGASGVIATFLKGGKNVILARSAHALDLIPVDYVVNLIIVATTIRIDDTNHVPVYHSCTSESNPITLAMLRNFISKYVSENYPNSHLNPEMIYTMSKTKMHIVTLLKQTLPARIGDLILHLKGKDKKYIKLLEKITLLRKMLSPFTSKSWVIRAEKTKDLEKMLSESDKATFPFNPKNIIWSKYVTTYTGGIQTYLLK